MCVLSAQWSHIIHSYNYSALSIIASASFLSRPGFYWYCMRTCSFDSIPENKWNEWAREWERYTLHSTLYTNIIVNQQTIIFPLAYIWIGEMFVFYNCTNLAAQTHAHTHNIRGPRAIHTGRAPSLLQSARVFLQFPRIFALRRGGVIPFCVFVVFLLFCLFSSCISFWSFFCAGTGTKFIAFRIAMRPIFFRPILAFSSLDCDFYRLIFTAQHKKKTKKRIDTSFRGHLELVAHEQEQALQHWCFALQQSVHDDSQRVRDCNILFWFR